MFPKVKSESDATAPCLISNLQAPLELASSCRQAPSVQTRPAGATVDPDMPEEKMTSQTELKVNTRQISIGSPDGGVKCVVWLKRGPNGVT